MPRHPEPCGRSLVQGYRPERLDLVPELDPELLPRAAACLAHQGDGILRTGLAGVLDEVRVLRRDLRAADAVALQAARLQHATCRELVVGVLEHAAERAPVRGLSLLAPRVQRAHLRLD